MHVAITVTKVCRTNIVTATPKALVGVRRHHGLMSLEAVNEFQLLLICTVLGTWNCMTG